MNSFIVTRADAVESASPDYPFFPSLIRIAGDKTLTTDDFTSNDQCANCHREIHNQWTGSMHFNSFEDPVWRSMWTLAFNETEGRIGNECLSCHTPIGVLTHGITKPGELGTLDALSASGVQCDFCHTISDTRHLETDSKTPHNMAFTITPGDIKRGPYKDAESPMHETAYSQLHESAEFCGNCHNVYHPETGLPIENTYDEWKLSTYAANGIVCQNCHMIPVEKLAEVAATMKAAVNPGQASEIGPQRDNVFSHEFVGGNTAMYSALESKSKYDIAVKRLKIAAALDASGPAKTPATGSDFKIDVKVTNAAAGHNLPTSLPELRQMWLCITAKDAKGKVIYQSGALDAKGELGADAVIFNAQPKDANGNPTIKPWEIARIDNNRTIPPKGTASESFSFTMPAGSAGPVKVAVALRYRSFSPAVVRQLLGPKAGAPPIVDMASKTIIIPK